MFKSWNILIRFPHYSAILFLFCLQLILFQQLNLITLVIFLQQETKVAEWLYFKGNKRSVTWKTKVLLLRCSCVAQSHFICSCCESLNGWVVFPEDDVNHVYKYLPRAEFGNVAWWWFHPLTAFKKTLTKYSGFVMCTYYAQYHKCRIAFEVSPKLYT